MKYPRVLGVLLALFLSVGGGMFFLLNQSNKELQGNYLEPSFLAAGIAVLKRVPEEQGEQAQEKSAFKPQPTTPLTTPPLKPPPPLLTPSPTPNPAPMQTIEPELWPEPQRAAPPPISPAQSPRHAEKVKININTAGPEELEQITGVGPIIAQRIIEYRNTNGQFQRIEDIKNIQGIGEVNFEKMKDEITVGEVVSPVPAPTQSPPPVAEPGEININTADYEEVQKITGVGPVIAQRIIDFREQNGPFRTIEDIKKVKGIGEATFEKMKDEITI